MIVFNKSEGRLTLKAMTRGRNRKVVIHVICHDRLELPHVLNAAEWCCHRKQRDSEWSMKFKTGKKANPVLKKHLVEFPDDPPLRQTATRRLS